MSSLRDSKPPATVVEIPAESTSNFKRDFVYNQFSGRLAQLVRAFASHAKGQRFESSIVHKREAFRGFERRSYVVSIERQRGGAQPEASDGETRGAGESSIVHKREAFRGFERRSYVVSIEGNSAYSLTIVTKWSSG